jgi:hypothetical protein
MEEAFNNSELLFALPFSSKQDRLPVSDEVCIDYNSKGVKDNV